MSDEGTGEGTVVSAGTGAETGAKAPEWTAQLPADLKANEAFTSFKTLGDLGKSFLELRGKAAELDGMQTKLSGAIFKPGADAKPEEVSAYYKALGVPEDAKEYEFPKVDGVEHDDKMTEWARQTFKTANLSKEQAATISQAWDGFMVGLAEAEAESVKAGVKAAEEALKKEWTGDTYNTNIEITKRGYQAFEKIVPGFGELLDSVTVTDGVKLGNDPRMLKVFNAIGKAIGDDLSIPTAKPAGQAKPAGDFTSIYGKTNFAQQ